jgi:peptidyl-prolyl cis-trans isomerase C
MASPPLVKSMVQGLSLLGTLMLVGCDRHKSDAPAPAQSATVSRQQLDDEQASKVLARVGKRTITLGDYVSALERMDPFERLRYQTTERRKLLLDEIVNVELLAREAERRGLDRRPETEEAIRQLMREELLQQLRSEQPALDEIPDQHVRAYYEQHEDEFKDPTRRRVSVIAVRSRKLAQELLPQAAAADPTGWGKLVRAHSVLSASARGSSTTARPPLDLEGDLGLVSAPDQGKGQNEKVPEAVREALFKIKKLGEVYAGVVSDRDLHYIVRLMGESPARTRKLDEVDNNIRVRLLRRRLLKAEQELEQQLRKKYPVVINEALLVKLKVPPQVESTPAPVPPAATPSSTRPSEAP